MVDCAPCHTRATELHQSIFLLEYEYCKLHKLEQAISRNHLQRVWSWKCDTRGVQYCSYVRIKNLPFACTGSSLPNTQYSMKARAFQGGYLSLAGHLCQPLWKCKSCTIILPRHTKSRTLMTLHRATSAKYSFIERSSVRETLGCWAIHHLRKTALAPDTTLMQCIWRISLEELEMRPGHVAMTINDYRYKDIE